VDVEYAKPLPEFELAPVRFISPQGLQRNEEDEVLGLVRLGEDLTLGGLIELEYTRKDNYDLDRSRAADRTDYDLAARLQATWDPSPDFFALVSARMTQKWRRDEDDGSEHQDNLVLAAAFGAPLGERANPGMSPNPAKAPWYFVGFQELLIHLHPAFAVMVVPLLGAIAFVLLPYLSSNETGNGVWFLSPAGRRSSLLAATTALVTVPLLVLLDEMRAAGPVGWLTGGLLPLAGLSVFVVAFAALIRKRFGTTSAETLQAVVVLLFVAFAVLTAIGIWFRGEGMALTWP